MNNFLNRPDWPKFDRALFQVILAMTTLAFGFFVYALLHEGSFVFPLEKNLVPELSKIKLFNYFSPYGDFTPSINSIINFQKYSAGDFQMPIWPGRIFQISFFLCISVLTAMIIRISGWLFYIGLSLILLFLVYFKVQEFGIITDYQDYFLYGAVALIVGLVFYLHNYQFQKSFKFHFFSSALIWAILWTVILVFGEGNEILFQLSNFAFPACIIISIAFIILIGHEPIHLFFAMISYSSSQFSRARMVNFIILALLYLGNVGLTYARTIGKIHWDIIYTPFQLMLLFAIIGGFYGFSKRFDSMKIFESKSVLMLIYATLSLFTLSFMTFAYYAGHDAIIEILEDATLYSQLGMGTIFFFYLIVNFGDLLQQKVKAYKVVYRPTRFPIMTAFIGGIVIMVAMFMRSSMFPYYQSMGIIYSGMADNYLVNGDVKMAQVFYEEASVFAFNNSRTTMNQADIYKQKGNRQATVLSLKNSIFKNPEPVHFIDLATQFEGNDKYFDAIFSLQEGINDFPKSTAIANNLGLLYTKGKLYDSAFIYFNMAEEESRERNLSAMLSKASYFDPDSLPKLDFKDLTELTNRITIYNKAARPFRDTIINNILKDSIINFGEYSYFYNLNINRLVTGRAILIDEVNALLKIKLSDEYLRDLYLLRGLNFYFQNNIANAISDFEKAVNFSGMTSPYVADLIGTLLMAKELNTQAEPYIERAERAVYENAPLKLMAIYTEKGEIEKLKRLVKRPYVKKNLGDSIHSEWLSLIDDDQEFEQWKESSEMMRYAGFKLYKNELSVETLTEIAESFKSEFLKSSTAADILDIKIQTENIEAIETFYNNWSRKLQSPSDMDEILLRYFYNEKEYEKFQSYFSKISSESLYYPLFQAWYSKLIGPKSEYLQNAAIAINTIGYDPSVMLMKVDLMNAEGKGDSEIYQVLVEDLMIYPGNVELGKAYVLQAARIGLESYAEKELEDLKINLNSEDYTAFFTEYQKVLKEHGSSEDW